MSDKDKFTYTGDPIQVHWDGKLCIHYGECGRAEGDLFVAGRQPWCQPDHSSNSEVNEVVLRCPTGALTATFADGSGVTPQEEEAEATVTQNGPVYIKGLLDIEGLNGDAAGTEFRAALCRCGASKNKPFCDNSHDEAGFRDSGAVGMVGKGLTERGGRLNINPLPDGPVQLTGNLSIRSSTGRVAWEGNKVFLCRCGESKNKPFCDGAHRGAGFKSD